MNEIEEMVKIVCKEKNCREYCDKVMKYPNRYICLTRNGLEALYEAGYRKTEVKTNGDFFRRIGGTNTDEQFANGNIEVVTSIEGKELYIARLVGEVFSTQNEAYNANLEYLKQEYKGE